MDTKKLISERNAAYTKGDKQTVKQINAQLFMTPAKKARSIDEIFAAAKKVKV